jgi:hypothetical protein
VTVTADELAGLLHDALAAGFPGPAGPPDPAAGTPLPGGGPAGSIELHFAAVGRPVDTAHLRPPDGTTPTGARLWVEQAVSGIVDPVPGPGGSYLQGSRHLSREYDALVRAASTRRDGDPAAVAVVEARIARARKLLDDAAVVPISGPSVPYLPTVASPTDWYDPAGPHWVRLELSERTPAPPEPPAVVPPRVRPRWDWLVAVQATSTWLDLRPVAVDQPGPVVATPPTGPDPIDLGQVRTGNRHRVDRAATRRFEPADGSDRAGPGRFTALLAERVTDSVTPETAGPAAAATPEVATVRAIQGFAGVHPATVERSALVREVTTVNRPTRLDRVVRAEQVPLVEVVAPAVGPARSQQLTALIAARPTALLSALVEEAQPAPATGDGFSLELDYCWVGLDRIWLDQVLLGTLGWQVPGTAPGSFSAGDPDRPDQAVPVVPVGFVVVKDVVITANWSSQDGTERSSAAGLGPFLLAGSTFAAGTGELRIPGPQIIAWMCEVPPMLPPP